MLTIDDTIRNCTLSTALNNNNKPIGKSDAPTMNKSASKPTAARVIVRNPAHDSNHGSQNDEQRKKSLKECLCAVAANHCHAAKRRRADDARENGEQNKEHQKCNSDL